MENEPMQQIQNNSNATDPNPSVSSEFSLKETRPDRLARESLKKDKTRSTYDLVEQMRYLYVRVVKVRDMAIADAVELVAEVKLGNYCGITKTAALSNIEWDQVFAFSKECIQSSTVEISVKESSGEDHMGRVWFDLSSVPSRVPADSQLAPRWYKMEDKMGNKAKTGELMVSIWFGTQDDEAFAEAWHSEAGNVPFDVSIKSKVYHSPKLWYLRVSVIEAEHIMPGHKGPEVVRFPKFSAKVKVQNQCVWTKIAAPSATRSFSNPYWNQDLLFVVEEPFENSLRVSVEDRMGWNHGIVVATLELPVATIEKRVDERSVISTWFDLISHYGKAGDNNIPSTRFVPRIHLRVSLDGGYHAFDDVTLNSTDVRATDTRLWKPHIGVLEMRILGASGLMPMQIRDGEERATNAYCIAKYGQKWCRTRTVVDNLSPEWNEQCNWEVYDLCTVVTVGVFDNRRIVKNNTKNTEASDYRIGKLRIRLSALEIDRVYTSSYPLLVVHPSGVKKTGELHLGMRLSCSNAANMLLMYTMPLLPKMHYTDPLTENQMSSLRYAAQSLLASRLSREEPPLGRGIVEFMLHDDMWNLRRSKTNFFRLLDTFSCLLVMGRSLKAIRDWQQPVYSALFLIIFVTLVMLPEFIIPTITFFTVFKGLRCYHFRPRHPPQMSASLSGADITNPEELDEEFDTFPTSRRIDIVRMRYDRLRFLATNIQILIGNMAEQLERFEALLSWRDPRATFLFLVLCLAAAVGFYVVPIRVVIALFGLYSLRPPWFRSKLPSAALNFFRRLPTDEVGLEDLKGRWFDLLKMLGYANWYPNVHESIVGQ